jgi:glycosyltransferase involved in cell wall biosynthesis
MRDNMPFISVVIPAYNEERYLPACLKSLQKQTYPSDRYEIILADNNSNDKTSEIAKKYGAKVIKEKRQGHVFALGAGIHAAKGEIIAATDADTIVNHDWLELIENAFRDKEVVAITGAAYYHTPNKKREKYLGKISYYGYLIYQKFHFAVGKPFLAGNNLAVRRKAYDQINGLDTRYEIFSDHELGLRIKKVGKVKFHKDICVASSARRWEKGSLEDYYKYFNSYFKTAWVQRPPKGNLTPRR